MKRIHIIIIALLLSQVAMGQSKSTDTTASKQKRGIYINLGNGGVKFGTDSSRFAKKRAYATATVHDSTRMAAKSKSKFESHFVLLDLGINVLQDNTNYNSTSAQKMLAGVDPSRRNSSLFDLRTSKSINVNLWLYMEEWKAVQTKNQAISFITGIGLQFYNFRYDNPLSYTKQNTIYLDNINFKKDKAAIDYLTVPLMVNFKTRLWGNSKDHKNWLVYGAGITEGLRVVSWTKQRSIEYGKVKLHDDFGFQDFNTCVTGEIGLDGYIRFYGSYQLTSLYKDGLDQHTICIGVRFLGI
jgi:hypothetical protein